MKVAKSCEFVVDHFAARTCGKEPHAWARDVDRRARLVCSQHAAALVTHGSQVSYSLMSILSNDNGP